MPPKGATTSKKCFDSFRSSAIIMRSSRRSRSPSGGSVGKPRNAGGGGGGGGGGGRSNSEASSDRMSQYSNSKRSRSPRSRSRGRSRSRSPYNSEYRLHIADIGEGVKKIDVERLFGEFGGLKEIWMANSPPCFGFAVYKNKSNASAALKATDGLMLGGSRIRVSHARPRTRGLGRRFYNPNMRCYECGTQGHFYRDCPDLGDGKYSRRHLSRHSPRKRYSSSSYGRNERRYSEDRSPDDDHRRRRRR